TRAPLHSQPIVLDADAHADHRDLHSFPTRRSSDLHGNLELFGVSELQVILLESSVEITLKGGGSNFQYSCSSGVPGLPDNSTPRSEEHTSELQSRENLVCRLLLEKKQ